MGKQASLRSLSFNLTINLTQSVLIEVLEAKTNDCDTHTHTQISQIILIFKKILISKAGWKDGVRTKRDGKCSKFHKNLAVKWANQLMRRGFCRSCSGHRQGYL